MANKSERSHRRYKEVIRTQGTLDKFIFIRSSSTSTHSARSSHSWDTLSASDAASDTGSNRTQSSLAQNQHMGSHNTSDTEVDVMIGVPSHRPAEEEESDPVDETDDEVEELIEGRDPGGSGGKEANVVQSWPDIRKKLDSILAKEVVKRAMPYRQVRFKYRSNRQSDSPT
jgi:hypothetical protein